MRHFALFFALFFSFTLADNSGSVENKSQNSSHITISPITLAKTTVSTSLNDTGYDEEYSRKNNSPGSAISTTTSPVVRRPSTTTRRSARPTKRPETKGPVHSWDQADTCGGNILVPLSDDRNDTIIEETYQSTNFPTARTYPLICTWNVKVSKNCRHARIVLRLDERSRLPNEKECANGYIRVSPFMKEAKICGRIGDVPPLEWHVEDQQPEVVTISMRNIGLQEDKSAGLFFTLQGECLPYESNLTTNETTDTNSVNNQWLHQLWKNSAAVEGPTVFIPDANLAHIIPWMETGFDQHNPATLPPSTTLSTVTEANNMDNNLNRPPTTRRPRPTRRPNTRRPSLPTVQPVTVHVTTPRPIIFDQYDTCGGTIHVPLIFDRLSLHESSHFYTGRNFPLVCTWNVKVSPLCRRARVTMRVDVRSRLPDVDGCRKGYFTVSPIMKEAKLCGRIGTVPPFQWYVDVEKPEDVAIVMENIGLDDGRPEGISFSLQSECIPNRPDIKKIDVDIENYWSNSRWMSRVWEESAKGEGPRIITPGIYDSTTTSSSITSDVNDASNHWGDQLDIPWLILESPSNNTKSSNTSIQVSNAFSNDIVAPATIPLQSSTVPTYSLPTVSTYSLPTVSHDTSTIPWLILKSPSSHSPLLQPSTTLSPSTSTRPHTTVRPTTTRSSTTTTIRPTSTTTTIWPGSTTTTIRSTSTTQRPTSKISIHPIQSPNTTTTRPSSTTVRPSTTTTKKPTTRLATSSTAAIPSSTNKTTALVSTSTIRPPSSTTARPQTKRQSTTTRKSGTTTVPKTTTSPVLNVPNSNSKAATNVERPSASHYDVEVAIDEAISYITLQLEELKRRSGYKQSSNKKQL